MAQVKLKDQEIIDALREGPVGREIMQTREAELTKRRGELCAQLEMLIAPAGDNFVKMTAAIEKAAAKLDKVREAFVAAQRELQIAVHQRMNAGHAFDVRRSEIENELRASAHPAIAEFRNEMLDEHDRVRREPSETEGEVMRNPITGRLVEDTVKSNRPLIAARMKACREAIIAAEALQLTPDQTKVPAALQKLRDGLPSIQLAR